MLSGRPLNFVIWSHQIEISGDVSRLSHARARTKFRTLSGLRKRRLIQTEAERVGAKPESNNRWESELGHVCMYVCMYGIWSFLANQGT